MVRIWIGYVSYGSVSGVKWSVIVIPFVEHSLWFGKKRMPLLLEVVD